MTTMIDNAPPFQHGDAPQLLYAVAFVTGHNRKGSPCFYVIYASIEPEETYFLISIDEQGNLFFSINFRQFSRVERPMMWAWDENGIHPSNWILYCQVIKWPTQKILPSEHRAAYRRIVQDTAETIQLLGKRARAVAMMEQLGNKVPEPMFKFQRGNDAGEFLPLGELEI
jgi:hypothetical protein